MPKLIYQAIASLDGYVEDEAGNFDWAAPDEEVHAFVNDLERPIGTYLYGRRMYETMVFWETADTGTDQPAVTRDFAEIWRAADKIVYSRSLKKVSSARTRIERDLDPDAARQRPRAARTPRRAPIPKRRRSSSIPRKRLINTGTRPRTNVCPDDPSARYASGSTGTCVCPRCRCTEWEWESALE
jgi:hypothetical protein